MPDFAVRTAFTATDKLSPAFNKMGKNVNRFGQQGTKAFGRMNMSAMGLMGTLRMLAPGFGLIGLASLANKAINLASALNEVENVVNVTFGKKGGNDINKWSKTVITKFGISELQAKKFSSQFGAMAQASGIAGDKLMQMSKQVAERSGDLMSFWDIESADIAFEKLQSIVTGTVKPMRSMGISMTVANLEAFALSKNINKSWKNMTQAEQVMLRYDYVMEKTSRAQGDFNRTLMVSFANQKKVLSTQFDQFMANIAIKFLPSLIAGFDKMNKFLAYMSENSDKFSSALSTIFSIIKYTTIAFLSYKAALMLVSFWQGVISAVGWIQYLWMMRTAIIAAAKATGILNLVMSLNPIGLIVIGVAALIAGFTILAIKAGGIGNAFMVLGKIIMKALLVPLNMTLYMIRAILKLATYIPGVGDTAKGALDKVSGFQNKMNKTFEVTEFDKKEAPNKAQLAANQGQTNININNKNVETDATSTPKRNVKITGNMGVNK